MEIVVTKSGDIKAIVSIPNVDVPPVEVWLRKSILSTGDEDTWLSVGPAQFETMPHDAVVTAVYIVCEIASALVFLGEAARIEAHQALRFEAGSLGFQVFGG